MKKTSESLGRIFSIVLCMSMLLSIGSVFAEDVESDVQGSKLTQDELLPGEKIVGDTIYGAEIISDVNSPLKGRAYGPNYAESKETALFWYTGYIQFVPAYLTSLSDGSGLVGGRHVSQAHIDYKRKEVSVTGGGAWTAEATNINDNSTYSTTVKVMDDPVTWGEEGRTYFYRTWTYFN